MASAPEVNYNAKLHFHVFPEVVQPPIHRGQFNQAQPEKEVAQDRLYDNAPDTAYERRQSRSRSSMSSRQIVIAVIILVAILAVVGGTVAEVLVNKKIGHAILGSVEFPSVVLIPL
jgi:hypothetical protein